MDLVDLCVPTPLHVPQTLAALQAGKHVICEKPLARTSAQSRQIVEAAAAAQTFFMPAMCMRFWPGWAWLKDLKTAGTYGDILTARFRRVSAPPGWSRDSYFKGGDSGGALFDLHVHDTDFVQFLFGRPTAVFSTGVSRFSGATDHVVTQYMVPGGATVYSEGSWLLASGFAMSYTVMFERATVDYDSARGDAALQVWEEGKEPQVIVPEGPDGYVGELQHLITAIRTGHGADHRHGAGRPERGGDLRSGRAVGADRPGRRALIRHSRISPLSRDIPWRTSPNSRPRSWSSMHLPCGATSPAWPKPPQPAANACGRTARRTRAAGSPGSRSPRAQSA